MNVVSGPRIRRLTLAVGAALLAVCLSLGAYLGEMLLTGNFHAVIAHELYRSAQPTAKQLTEYKKSYNIKTIVNLRGSNASSPWYESEVSEAEQLGITHIDFRMSAKRELSEADASALIALLRKAEKPILIHCTSGADRSGLAAALYVAAVSKLGEAAAESQISIRYGHISLPISPAYAMDRSFIALEPLLGFRSP
jgi:protein tyrosine/serine phosphatase